MAFIPVSDDELAQRVAEAKKILGACTLCPRECRVNRLEGERGFCGGGILARVASYNSHFGEEPPISGERGSGTIFFSGCTLRCLFCQNYPISQFREGRDVTNTELSEMFLKLQRDGCHNINFVTPTHFVPQILEALFLAKSQGFNLPLVYNTSGYESAGTLKILEGVVAIYLPDLKYGDDTAGQDLSGVNNYFTFSALALKEMFSQVGLLKIDRKGPAREGLIVRHLILPDNLSTTDKVLRFLSEELSPEITISLMAQYFPAHKAISYPHLNRRVSSLEYKNMVKLAQDIGLHNLFIQEIDEN